MKDIRAGLILIGLVLLMLSACQPQSGDEPAVRDLESGKETAVPDDTVPIETVMRTPILEPVTPTAPKPAEETIMPIEPTEQPLPVEDEEAAYPAPSQPTGEPEAEPTLQPGVQGWVAEAKEDLANRLSISTSEIELLSFESKVWSDAGLGCPKPGMVYAQVLQEGYLIRLAAGDETYNYHGGGDGSQPPFLCEQAGPEIVITKNAPLDIKEVATKIVPPPSD